MRTNWRADGHNQPAMQFMMLSEQKLDHHVRMKILFVFKFAYKTQGSTLFCKSPGKASCEYCL